MFIVYPQLIKKTHLAWKCHRLCTFKLSGNFPSRRILLSRNVNVPGTIGSPQPAGTDSHLPPVPSAPRRALSCAVLRFFHQDRLAAQFYHIAPDMQRPLAPVDVRPPQAAGPAPAHARGKAHLEIGLIFQALTFQFGDKPLHYFLNRHRTLLQRAFLLVPRRNVSVFLLFRVLSP
mgnify:CR=1 FL=1